VIGASRSGTFGERDDLAFSRGPAAAEGAKGFDGGARVIGVNLRHRIARGEQLAVGVEDLDMAAKRSYQDFDGSLRPAIAQTGQ